MGCVSGVLPRRPAVRCLVGFQSLRDGIRGVIGDPVAPYVGVAVQPPESGVIYGGIRVVVLPFGNFLEAVYVEAPLTQHVNDIRRSVIQFRIHRNQNRGVLVCAGLAGGPALVAVRGLL